jgi:large subunit ribosomal protein L24
MAKTLLKSFKKQSATSAKRVAKRHVKRGDTVMVISGKDKGKTGIVKRVFADKNKVLVEGINVVKKAVRPNPMLGQRGGIVEMEAPLYISKVMVYDLKASKPTRIRRETVKSADGQSSKQVRVSKKSGEQLDD